MSTYNLEIEAVGIYLTDMPVLEIWSESFLDSSYAISQFGSTISLTLSYGGALPSSLQFRFDDGSSEPDRVIEIRSVIINDREVNVGNFLSVETLLHSVTSTIDTLSSGFLFNSSDPDPSIFLPISYALSSMNDHIRIYDAADYVLDGLDGRDTFYMGAGNDIVSGGDGDDIIRGGGGHDLLFGAAGNDRLFGQAGNDLLYGGDGNDTIYGEDGNDEIHGGLGDDRLNGHDGEDIITGDDGDDRIGGGSGVDYLYGDAGADQIIGGDGDDTIDGGSGDDILYGGSGDDIISGGDDNDVLSGDSGNDILNGGDGDDDLYGDAGVDILNGGRGADTLYSGSQQNLAATISNILSNNANLHYNADTNSFYRYVGTGISWDAANSNASAATLVGLSSVNGHLVTATSSFENSYIYGLSGGNSLWLSASDAANEGEWIWTSGPEAGQKFWTGGLLGFSFNSLYSDWALLNPSNVLSNRDYAELTVASTWESSRSIETHGYIIEWEATSLLNTVDKSILNGGDGIDALYGDVGIDIFVIDNTNDIDVIYNFEAAGRDQLDIRDIINGYDSLSDDLTDFVRLTEVGGNTTVSVDPDGTMNSSNYIDVATLDGVTGLDLRVLIAGDNLIVE